MTEIGICQLYRERLLYGLLEKLGSGRIIYTRVSINLGVIVDHRMAAVGTSNLDNRSFRLNFEVTAFVTDADFIQEVNHMLEKDFSKCIEARVEEFTNKSYFFKIACRAARLMSPLQ